MSTDSHAADDHGHGHGHGAADGDHHPHVLPMSTYLLTWGTLLVLTVVTVGVSYVNLGHATNLAIALGIATVKATVVAAIFMHLRYDHKFHTLILSSAFIFLAVFISFTMFDTEARGKCETIEGIKVKEMKHPFAVATEDVKESATVVPQDTPGTNTLALPERFPAPTPAEPAAHGEHGGHGD